MRLIGVILTLIAQAVCAYTYPTGIPSAWVEPDVTRPARPSPWTSPQAGYYYIDWTTGTDSGRTYGDPTAPRKTIPASIPAGSYVEINGTYTGSGDPIIITGAGDSGAWVANTSGPAWVCGLDANNRASFGNRIVCKGTYLYLDQVDNLASAGKRFQISTPSAGVGIDADYIMVRNFMLYGDDLSSSSSGFEAGGNTDSSMTNVIIYNGTIHGFGDDTPGMVDADYVGIFVGDYSQNVWLLDNEIYDMAGAGVAVSANATDTVRVSEVYAGRNTIYDTWAAGMAVKTCDNVVFSQNVVHTIDWTEWSDAKGLGAQYSCQNVWYIYNTIYNCDFGIRFGSTNNTPVENAYIIGNVIYDIQEDPDGTYETASYASAAISMRGADNRYIIANTIYDSKGGIYSPDAMTATVVENNIISGITDYEIYIDQGAGNATVRNNDIYLSGGGEIIRFSSTNRSVSAYNTAFGGSANISSDPLFTNAAGADFTLQVASGAIGTALAAASLTVNAYSTYQTDFSQSILFDRAGTARPQNTTWDIGAYESTIGGGGGGGGTFNATTLNITNLTVGP